MFPSVPDMSPKKVSAVHNVYVSPLRASKVKRSQSWAGGRGAGDNIVLTKPSMCWCVCRWMLLFLTAQGVHMLALERAHVLTKALQKTYQPSTIG